MGTDAPGSLRTRRRYQRETGDKRGDTKRRGDSDRQLPAAAGANEGRPKNHTVNSCLVTGTWRGEPVTRDRGRLPVRDEPQLHTNWPPLARIQRKNIDAC